MLEPMPFALHATSADPTHAELAPPPLMWRCSHETCGLLIDALEPLWLRHGRLDQALRTAELRLCLPFDERGMRSARRRLQHVRARLN